jgi:HEAT repeat protein
MSLGLVLLSAHIISFAHAHGLHGAQQSLTPVQAAIEKERARLGSGEAEERRDAVVRLGSMHHPEASRAAVEALKDPLPIIRATAASAILSMPAEESVANLIPLLGDKDEFVRREAAYALGSTRSTSATSALIERLLTDKKDEVRSAAAVALGQIKDAGSVSALVSVLSQQPLATTGKKKQKQKKEQNVFVLRAVAQALGEIGSRNAVGTLIATLQDEKSESDVRREAASALGLIGDDSAMPALQAALNANDPYLAEIARSAIRRIKDSKPPGGM